MAVVAQGRGTGVPHVPDLAAFVEQARRAGAATEAEGLDLVRASLGVLAAQWSDGVRIRLVAAAPVDVARWLVPPRNSGTVPQGASLDQLATVVAEACDSPHAVALGTLQAVIRGLAEVLPPETRPGAVSRPR